MNSSGKVLLILGASSDIGIEFIKKVSKEYSSIIAHYNRTSEVLQKLKKGIGEKIILCQSDFSNENSTNNFVKCIVDLGLIPTHILHLPSEKGTIKRFQKLGWKIFENRIYM